MNHQNQQHADEKSLWRQFAEQYQAQPTLSDLDPNLLAVYLDGKANTTQVKKIEALMASDPALLDQIIELRSLQDSGPAMVSQAFLDRAKALTAPQQTTPVVVRRTWTWPRSQWAAAAAAVVLACLAGYSVGQTTFQGRGSAEDSLSSQASLELDGLTLALVLQPNGSNGVEE